MRTCHTAIILVAVTIYICVDDPFWCSFVLVRSQRPLAKEPNIIIFVFIGLASQYIEEPYRLAI